MGSSAAASRSSVPRFVQLGRVQSRHSAREKGPAVVGGEPSFAGASPLTRLCTKATLPTADVIWATALSARTVHIWRNMLVTLAPLSKDALIASRAGRVRPERCSTGGDRDRTFRRLSPRRHGDRKAKTPEASQDLRTAGRLAPGSDRHSIRVASR